jgi:hypothetical protein
MGEDENCIKKVRKPEGEKQLGDIDIDGRMV